MHYMSSAPASGGQSRGKKFGEWLIGAAAVAAVGLAPWLANRVEPQGPATTPPAASAPALQNKVKSLPKAKAQAAATAKKDTTPAKSSFDVDAWHRRLQAQELKAEQAFHDGKYDEAAAMYKSWQKDVQKDEFVDVTFRNSPTDSAGSNAGSGASMAYAEKLGAVGDKIKLSEALQELQEAVRDTIHAEAAREESLLKLANEGSKLADIRRILIDARKGGTLIHLPLNNMVIPPMWGIISAHINEALKMKGERRTIALNMNVNYNFIMNEVRISQHYVTVK
jgi:hypothetical protein